MRALQGFFAGIFFISGEPKILRIVEKSNWTWATGTLKQSATIEAGLIKPDQSIGGSRKFARYLPFWA